MALGITGGIAAVAAASPAIDEGTVPKQWFAEIANYYRTAVSPAGPAAVTGRAARIHSAVAGTGIITPDVTAVEYAVKDRR
jgi:hypothetical protein